MCSARLQGNKPRSESWFEFRRFAKSTRSVVTDGLAIPETVAQSAAGHGNFSTRFLQRRVVFWRHNLPNRPAHDRLLRPVTKPGGVGNLDSGHFERKLCTDSGVSTSERERRRRSLSLTRSVPANPIAANEQGRKPDPVVLNRFWCLRPFKYGQHVFQNR